MMTPLVSLLCLACLALFSEAAKKTGGHQTDEIHLGCGPVVKAFNCLVQLKALTMVGIL